MSLYCVHGREAESQQTRQALQLGQGHLERYCDEFAFRYTTRAIGDGERAELAVQGGEGKRLTYKQPAGASQN
jgi:hypothetical protein